MGPDYKPATPSVPDAWQQVVREDLDPDRGKLTTWWETFDDPVLESLIERARQNNLDMRLAIARVEEARAFRGVAKGQWFPDVDGVGSATQSRLSEETVPFTFPGFERTDELFNIGVDASWELDLWGRIRRSVESANAGVEASVEEYRDVLVLVFSEVARQYVNVRTIQSRIRLALSNIQSQRDTLKLTQDRNEAELVPDLDVRQAELNLARTESIVPQLRQALLQSLHRLGVLVGQHPAALFEQLGGESAVPAPAEVIAAELPAEVMRQRPDVRRAERELAAQSAQIGVATAELYPRFSLLGTFAFEARDVGDVFTGDARTFSIGPAFRWNIFDAGRVRGRIKVEEARAEQAMVFYEQTVLLALEEVENALVAYVQERSRNEALRRAVEAALQSVDLVQTLYRAGLVDFQNVLDMERALFLQQDELAESDGAIARNVVQLYKALGGGWSAPVKSFPGSASFEPPAETN